MRWIYESSRRRTGNREDKWECIRNQKGNEPISSISTSKKHFTQIQQVVEIKDLGKKEATELLYMTKQFGRREEHKRPESCTSRATLISASSMDTTSKYHATWQLETFISLLEIQLSIMLPEIDYLYQETIGANSSCGNITDTATTESGYINTIEASHQSGMHQINE